MHGDRALPTEVNEAIEDISVLGKGAREANEFLRAQSRLHPSVSPVQAESLRESLIEAVRDSTQLHALQGTAFLPCLDEYIRNPNERTWTKARIEARNLSMVVDRVTYSFQQVSNEYVFEKSYRQFLTLFGHRSRLLRLFQQEPLSIEDVDRIRKAYGRLTDELSSLIDTLSAYAKKNLRVSEKYSLPNVVPAPAHIRAANPVLIVALVFAGAFGLFCILGGIQLMNATGSGETNFDFLGLKFTTKQAGVAAIALGAAAIILTFRKVLKTVVDLGRI